MAHILYNLDTDIKEIVESHTTSHTLGQFRKGYKIIMDKYNINGNFSMERQIKTFTIS